MADLLMFQPFLRFYTAGHVPQQGPKCRFQPFLRFYDVLCAELIGVVLQLFQPFLRFYFSQVWTGLQNI